MMCFKFPHVQNLYNKQNVDTEPDLVEVNK